MPERWAALGRAAAFFVVLVMTIGGMYAGVFTVTEASARPIFSEPRLFVEAKRVM
jgi:TRAP-type C4-dicarboxylate transport system permease large subunit